MFPHFSPILGLYNVSYNKNTMFINWWHFMSTTALKTGQSNCALLFGGSANVCKGAVHARPTISHIYTASCNNTFYKLHHSLIHVESKHPSQTHRPRRTTRHTHDSPVTPHPISLDSIQWCSSEAFFANYVGYYFMFYCLPSPSPPMPPCPDWSHLNGNWYITNVIIIQK